MLDILTTRYPLYDWTTNIGDLTLIVYMSGTDEYRVVADLWPTDVYPTIPTSDDIKGWLEGD